MSRYPSAAILALLLLFPAFSHADIYRWEDEAGTLHFTDDPSNIPASYRGKAKMMIQEAPPEPAPVTQSPRGRGISTPPAPSFPAPSRETEAEANARERDSVASQIDQLKAKIAAKENLIKTVDDRRNLILNPLRSRVVDPADLELYGKYQAELPEDRERLQELETRLQLFK